MIKIWGKVMSHDHIIKQKTIEIDETSCTFFDMLKDVCVALNIPTPVLLDKHVYDFNLFHTCIFKPSDFVENVVFSEFILQHIGVT